MGGWRAACRENNDLCIFLLCNNDEHLHNVLWRVSSDLLCFWILFNQAPLGVKSSQLICLECPFRGTMTAMRTLWRKCLPLCASHFPVNQPAIRLSLERVSLTAPGSSDTAVWLSVQITFFSSPVLLSTGCFDSLCFHSFFFFLLWLLGFSLSLSVVNQLPLSTTTELFHSVLQEEVSCHINVVVWSSEGLQGIDPGETHFH